MIIVSASSAEFFHFLQGMVLSIREKPEGASIALGCFDLGLSEQQKSWLTERAVEIVVPDWPFGLSDAAGVPLPFKAILCRPLLPRYFPGHDVYMHMDADAWVQDWEAIEFYRAGAARGLLAITPEIDRSFISNYGTADSYRAFIVKVFTDLCGAEVAQKYRNYPILNTGVFAMPAGSPMWGRWARRIEENLHNGRNFHIEQASLNFEVFEHFDDDLAQGLEFLPSRCNWVCHQALPKFDVDRGLLVEPFLPHTPLGVIHRASDDFKQKKTGQIALTAGGTREMNLKYREGRYGFGSSDEPEHLERWQDAGFEWTEKAT